MDEVKRELARLVGFSIEGDPYFCRVLAVVASV